MLLFYGTNLCPVNTLNLSFMKRDFIDYCYSLLVTLLLFGAVGRMATCPVVLPEVFNREGSWHQWIFHFENVATVKEWNEDSCLHWMKAICNICLLECSFVYSINTSVSLSYYIICFC